jgi:hypothetical protein
MEYDITVPEVNEGQYDIVMGVVTETDTIYVVLGIDIYLDDILLGRVSYPQPSEEVEDTNAVTANLFAGEHRLRWSFPPRLGGSLPTGFNIAYLKLTRVDDVVMNDCDDVILYEWGLAGDIEPDCVVDANDLSVIADSWLECNDPDPTNCP